MAESSTSSTSTTTTKPSTTSSASTSTSPQSSSGATPGIGSIVLVRSTISSVVPAIVTNDFGGGNAPGVVSLIVFNAADFNNVLVKAVPSAQPETKDISAEDLSRELFVWWMPVGSDLAKRDLQKELDDKAAERQKAIEAEQAKQAEAQTSGVTRS